MRTCIKGLKTCKKIAVHTRVKNTKNAPPGADQAHGMGCMADVAVDSRLKSLTRLILGTYSHTIYTPQVYSVHMGTTTDSTPLSERTQ